MNKLLYDFFVEEYPGGEKGLAFGGGMFIVLVNTIIVLALVFL